MKNKYSYIYNHDTFNSTIDALTKNQFYRDIGKSDQREKISDENLRYSSWIASILALSEFDDCKSKSLMFGILAYLEKEDDPCYRTLCYTIISRTGNIPLDESLTKIFDLKKNLFKISFDPFLDYELGSKRIFSKIEIGNEKYYISEYQKDIYESLNKGKYISISGPTSSGKSFVIQNYIIDKLNKESEFKAIYVVPTRALISEVQSYFKGRLKDPKIKIKTGIGNPKEKLIQKEIFVLTPERSLKLFELNRNSALIPNLIYFDEIQNIEDEERGVLLEYILTESSKYWKNSKIILGGPYLEKMSEIFQRIDKDNSINNKSSLISIYQTKCILKFHKGQKKCKYNTI